MGFRRLAVPLVVVALGLAACAGDDEDSAGVAVEQPIGAPETGGELGVSREPAPSVAKTGLVEMDVPKGGLTEAAQKVVDVATGPEAGGFLVSSVLDLANGYGSGSILVKVPAASFERTVVELGRIGDVRRQEMSGQDLTPDALRALEDVHRARGRTGSIARRLESTGDEAARAVLLERLRDAKAALESATGEQAFVRAQTSYSPIEVALAGRRPPPPPAESPFERATGISKDIAIGIASALVIAAGVVLPAGALVLAIYLVWSLVIRRLRVRWES